MFLNGLEHNKQPELYTYIQREIIQICRIICGIFEHFFVCCIQKRTEYCSGKAHTISERTVGDFNVHSLVKGPFIKSFSFDNSQC